jgi:hypothetical protein
MYEYKDTMRIKDIVTKSQKKGPNQAGARQLQFAGNMARAILDANKALRRAEAATALGYHHIAKVFYIRYGELTS